MNKLRQSFVPVIKITSQEIKENYCWVQRFRTNTSGNDLKNRVFPKLYKVGNIGNKGLQRKRAKELSKKKYSNENRTQDFWIFAPMPG